MPNVWIKIFNLLISFSKDFFIRIPVILLRSRRPITRSNPSSCKISAWRRGAADHTQYKPLLVIKRTIKAVHFTVFQSINKLYHVHLNTNRIHNYCNCFLYSFVLHSVIRDLMTIRAGPAGNSFVLITKRHRFVLLYSGSKPDICSEAKRFVVQEIYYTCVYTCWYWTGFLK